MSREPLRPEPSAVPEASVVEPPADGKALRAAVRRVSPDALSTFDIQHRYVRDLCSRTGDPIPVRMFLRRWGVFVELRNCPRRAARLARLELAASEATDTETARAAAQEIAHILDGATRRSPAP